MPLREYGHSRDHRSDREQVNLAIAVNIDGVPITYQVLPGDTADVATVKEFATLLKNGFDLHEPVFLVDRGMVSKPNLAHLENQGSISSSASAWMQSSNDGSPAKPIRSSWRRRPNTNATASKTSNGPRVGAASWS